MSNLQRVFDDLKHGENLDLYVTVSVALIVALINLFGFASQQLLASLSLAVLALLASAILGIRHQLIVVRKEVSKVGEPDISGDFPPEIGDDFERATEIWLFGVHLSGTLRHRLSLLESKLEKGNVVRALVANPDGAACTMAAARVPGKLIVERERALIIATLESLCDLKRRASDQMEIRTVDFLLPYGGFMLNPKKPDGVIYLKRYTFQTGLRPRFIYRQSSPWFNFTKSEIDAMWNSASEWACGNQVASS